MSARGLLHCVPSPSSGVSRLEYTSSLLCAKLSFNSKSAASAVLAFLPEAELKGIAGLSGDGVPPSSAHMLEAFEGKPKSSIQLAGRRDHAESIRNGLRRFAQADKGLSSADVLPPTQVVLRDSDVVEQDSRRVQITVKAVNILAP